MQGPMGAVRVKAHNYGDMSEKTCPLVRMLKTCANNVKVRKPHKASRTCYRFLSFFFTTLWLR